MRGPPLTLVWAGALGNIIDSAVYGRIFSRSGWGTLAEIWPSEGGGKSCMVFGSQLPGRCWKKVRFIKEAEFSVASFWATLFDAVPGCEFSYRVLVFAASFTNDKRNIFPTSQFELRM